MTELNLLPDVKLEYIKAQQARRLVLSISVLVSAVAVAILILLLGFDGLQKKHLHDLNNDIKNESSKLVGEPHINQILTVQNQLESLTALHASKPAVPRLFDYLNQVTPSSVDINNFTIDFTQYTATITGDADAISTVNQYVDTLKATTYTTDSGGKPVKAFSNVVLSSFGISTGTGTTPSTPNNTGGKPATYSVTLSYDKNIFDITQQITLSVPNITPTRSQTSQPADLFTTAPSNGGGH